MKYFIAIGGNIGAGKSTLTRLLATHLEWEPFMEAVDDNPYLADFYQDMWRWSFHSQIYFLSRRLRHHRALVDHPNSVVQDRSVYEDAEIFARNLYRQGNMGERDYKSYRELYEVLASFLPPPDLIVYLQASVDTLLQRISHRGRDYERDISRDYLERLNVLYEEWANTFSMSPVLVLNVDDFDYVNRPQDLETAIRLIREQLERTTVERQGAGSFGFRRR